MLLAELEIWHTRPITPTRRVALGHLVLPTDPAPGLGGVLLAANLTLGPAADVLDGLNDPTLWLTHSFGETAICVKRNEEITQ